MKQILLSRHVSTNHLIINFLLEISLLTLHRFQPASPKQNYTIRSEQSSPRKEFSVIRTTNCWWFNMTLSDPIDPIRESYRSGSLGHVFQRENGWSYILNWGQLCSHENKICWATKLFESIAYNSPLTDNISCMDLLHTLSILSVDLLAIL